MIPLGSPTMDSMDSISLMTLTIVSQELKPKMDLSMIFHGIKVEKNLLLSAASCQLIQSSTAKITKKYFNSEKNTEIKLSGVNWVDLCVWQGLAT